MIIMSVTKEQPACQVCEVFSSDVFAYHSHPFQNEYECNRTLIILAEYLEFDSEDACACN